MFDVVKRCSNCKFEENGICANCFGVEGYTEITESFSCENWVGKSLLEFCPYYSYGFIDFNVEPIGNTIFIWPKPVDERIGKIYIPDIARDSVRHNIGIVLACGKGRCRDFNSADLKPGDMVIYDNDVPWKVRHRDRNGVEQELVIVNDRDVKCLITKDNDVFPVSDFVLYEQIEEEKNRLGIFLPTALVRFVRVIAVGKGVVYVKQGDKAIVELKYAVPILNGEKKKIYVIRENWIQAVVEE